MGVPPKLMVSISTWSDDLEYFYFSKPPFVLSYKNRIMDMNMV